MRCGLEQLEPVRDMASFVRTYGTGNTIPDPPQFINYGDPHAVVQQRITSRPAQFQRVTERPQMFPPPEDAQPQPDGEQENSAGVGAGGGSVGRTRSVSRNSTRGEQRAPPQAGAPVVNGRSSSNRTPDPTPQEKTMLKVGNRTYEVDPTNDPQGRPGPSPGGSSSETSARVGDEEEDPLLRTMRELQRGTTTRRGTQAAQQPPAPSQSQQRPNHQQQNSSTTLSPPPGGRGGGPPNRNVDYRRSAEFVVGGLPPNVPGSRSASPNPPAPVLSRPPSVAADDTVQEVLRNYQQSLPGEHKNVSRSRANSYSSQAQPAPQGRPESMAGVGAQGRSPSPQPFRPPSRAASPNPQAQNPNIARAVSPARSVQSQQQQSRHMSPASTQSRRESYRGPPISAVAATGPTSLVNGFSRPSHQTGQSSISVPTQPIQRAASPNQVGIALDPSGRVAHDDLAERYNNARMYQQPPPSNPPPPQQPSYIPPVQQQQPQRTPSYPPPNQPGYAQPPANASPYGRTAQGFAQPAPPPQQPPVAAPPPHQQQPPYGQQYGQYQPPQDYSQVNGVQRNGSYNAPQNYYGNQQPVQQFAQQQQQRAPSPQPPPQPEMQPPQGQIQSPTGAYTDDGRPILFYGEH